MELKGYQKSVISDLESYLELLATNSISQAYRTLWENKGVIVGFGGLPAYNNDIDGVPHVCVKVPTGGGKTFIAANAVKPVFDSMPNAHPKAVVWLVPSDSILNQTLKNLSDVNHPYRQKLDVDFGGRVEVYSKSQLLNGQNFSPITIADQLSIFVLSYDSFRTTNKEGRKAYRQNGNLAPFGKLVKQSENLLEDTDETALVQVIRSLNPLIIVDESHHATSDLSLQMLKNFNPSFIFDLTATPKNSSNIISFVDAAQLKKENMVKLPVIVYNRKSQEDVYVDAITIRRKLELQAVEDQKKTGRYIRPIVLFQAQPRNSEESITFDKIKKTLMDLDIPEHHIAIKTADRDELKNIDLMSPQCSVRYIITVNALKEGWDCPFAYVLATVANRSSVVDVEQILGRVLRLPEAKKNPSSVLNLSYVLTSSANFNDTLEKVVSGLNNAGFSKKDYRAKNVDEFADFDPPAQFVQTEMPDNTASTPEESVMIEENVPEVNTSDMKERLDSAKEQMSAAQSQNIEQIISNDEMFSAAIEQNEEYEDALSNAEKTEQTAAPPEVRDKMNVFEINECFREEVSRIQLPQFIIKTELSLFTDDYKLLNLNDLDIGFTLKDKDAQIDFSTIAAEMARIDVEDRADSNAKAWKLSVSDSTYFKEWFDSKPAESRMRISKSAIKAQISKIDGVNDGELDDYIDRVVEMMTEDQISDLQKSQLPYIKKIKEKVEALLAEHRRKMFDLWLEQDRIQCRPMYSFRKTISPVTSTSVYPNSLYESEDGNLNEYEKPVVFEIASLPNLKWWHRNISRLGFQINGSVHAYPDLIIMTKSGKIVMVETKGDHLFNPESKEKARIGAKWAETAGSQYKYYMVFQTKQPDFPGACSFDRFMEIIRGL